MGHQYSYAGSLEDSLGNVVVPTVVPTITTISMLPQMAVR